MTNATALTQDAIKAAILQHLPAHVGEVLQAELQALKEVRAAHASTRALLETESTRRRDLESDIAAADLKHANAAKVLAREAAVATRELKQELRDLEVKLADLRRQDAVDLVKLVFRSPVFTRTVASNVPIAVDGAPASQYGGGTVGFVQQCSSTQAETTQEI